MAKYTIVDMDTCIACGACGAAAAGALTPHGCALHRDTPSKVSHEADSAGSVQGTTVLASAHPSFAARPPGDGQDAETGPDRLSDRSP